MHLLNFTNPKHGLNLLKSQRHNIVEFVGRVRMLLNQVGNMKEKKMEVVLIYSYTNVPLQSKTVTKNKSCGTIIFIKGSADP